MYHIHISSPGGGDKGQDREAEDEDRDDQDSLPHAAELYWLKGDKDKAEDAYGKGYIENQVFALAYNLINWANYWLGKDTHKDGALAMAEKALAMADNAYVVEQVAGIYLKLDKDDKALALFGPTYAEKNGGDPRALMSYASFRSGRGKNLEGALAAAR